MPSRRRSRSKNLGTNLADVQRRMRSLERKPVRTKLQKKVVTAVNIAPETITPDEVNFGTVITTPETDVNNVDVQNPKDGLLIVSTTDGSSSVYSGDDNTYYPIADPVAQTAADQAAADAAQAAEDAAAAAADAAAATDAAEAAELSANKKNTVFRQATTPTANSVGDVWFDTTPVTKDGYTDSAGARPKRWTGTVWEEFGLNYAAITSIDAGTINAGALIGRTVKTSASGNRVEMSNTDVISFYNQTLLDPVATIQPGFSNEGLIITAGTGGSTITMTGSDYAVDSSIIMGTSNNSGQIFIFDETYEGVAGGGVIVTGTTVSLRGGTGGFEVKTNDASVAIYGADGFLSMLADSTLTLGASAIVLSGDVVLTPGTYVQGSGAPTGTPVGGEGTIVFKYT